MQGSENLDVCVLGEDDPAFVDHSSSVCAAVLWDKGNKQGFGAGLKLRNVATNHCFLSRFH